LHVSGGGHAAYTALSYCWGVPQTFATTTETIDKRCEGFCLSDLPKTLREAILVTRKLGLRYIWIDSLCIVQDSTADKEKELSDMANVYKNAYVTICAARARSCHDGFLRVSGECKSHPGSGLLKDLFKIPYRCPDSTVGTIYMHEEQQYRSSAEYISRRAWTLQERLLSPRFLSYGSRLVWYCRTAQYSAGGTEDWSSDVIGSGLRQSHAYKLSLAAETTPLPSLDFFTLRQLYDTWHRIVAEYTRRELTFPADKLPAIAGLAAEFQKLTGDTYLAGLWQNNLAFELMWATNPDTTLNHSSTWRAPSWSWASVENAVFFDKITDDSTLVARIVKCEVTSRSQVAAFGEIVSGSLQVEAPLIHADRKLVREMVNQDAENPRPENPSGSVELLRRNTNSRTKANSQLKPLSMSKHRGPDHSTTLSDFRKRTELPKWEPPKDVYCLVMFSRSWWWDASKKVKELDRICYSGLVLKPVDGRFERIASFYNQKREWLSDTSRQIVTIV
jgi:hypothetical protein